MIPIDTIFLLIETISLKKLLSKSTILDEAHGECVCGGGGRGRGGVYIFIS